MIANARERLQGRRLRRFSCSALLAESCQVLNAFTPRLHHVFSENAFAMPVENSPFSLRHFKEFKCGQGREMLAFSLLRRAFISFGCARMALHLAARGFLRE